jgi:hypothetical protein
VSSRLTSSRTRRDLLAAMRHLPEQVFAACFGKKSLPHTSHGRPAAGASLARVQGVGRGEVAVTARRGVRDALPAVRDGFFTIPIPPAR